MVLSGVIIVIGGLMVALGVRGDLGALLLVFVLATAFLVHAPWKVQDPHQHMDQQVHLMKNRGLAGGSILAFVVFAGLGRDLGLTITAPCSTSAEAAHQGQTKALQRQSLHRLQCRVRAPTNRGITRRRKSVAALPAD